MKQFLIILMLGLTLAGASGGAVIREDLIPDTAIQTTIKQALHATTGAQATNNLERLRQLGGKNYEKLVPQVLWYSAKARDERDALASTMITGYFKVPKNQIRDAIMPYLWSTDPDLKRDLRDFLQYVEERNSTGEPDFSAYVPLLRDNKTDPPEVLIKYMFSSSPSMALEVLCNIYIDDPKEREQIMEANRALNTYFHLQHDAPAEERAKAKQTAQEAVKFLSQRTEWPVKQYLAGC